MPRQSNSPCCSYVIPKSLYQSFWHVPIAPRPPRILRITTRPPKAHACLSLTNGRQPLTEAAQARPCISLIRQCTAGRQPTWQVCRTSQHGHRVWACLRRPSIVSPPTPMPREGAQLKQHSNISSQEWHTQTHADAGQSTEPGNHCPAIEHHVVPFCNPFPFPYPSSAPFCPLGRAYFRTVRCRNPCAARASSLCKKQTADLGRRR